MMTYSELRAAFQQGDWLTIEHGGEQKHVEVVGHKEVRLKDGVPAVRVYVLGFGTVLYSERELTKMGCKPRSKAERNIFYANHIALGRGHELGDWVKHRAHLYSAQCVTCGAMVHADAHEYRGSAVTSLTCDQHVAIGRRALQEVR